MLIYHIVIHAVESPLGFLGAEFEFSERLQTLKHKRHIQKESIMP